MQKSVHELWGGKITIFELPLGPCARDENSRDRGRAKVVFFDGSWETERVACPIARSDQKVSSKRWGFARAAGSLANWSAAAKMQRKRSLSSPTNLKIPAPEHSSSVSSKNCAAFFTTSTSASLLFQKPLKSPPAKPYKINGRISSIRLFQKVWLMKQTWRTTRIFEDRA